MQSVGTSLCKEELFGAISVKSNIYHYLHQNDHRLCVLWAIGVGVLGWSFFIFLSQAIRTGNDWAWCCSLPLVNRF